MVKRLFLVLLVVCCVAGCGGPKPRTLENLTYAELTQLVNIEIAECEKGAQFFDEGPERDAYRDKFSKRIQLLQQLRKARMDQELPSAEKLVPKT